MRAVETPTLDNAPSDNIPSPPLPPDNPRPDCRWVSVFGLGASSGPSLVRGSIPSFLVLGSSELEVVVHMC